MAKKSGSNRLKRISAPGQWDIARKEARFIIKTSPGPHSIESSYPLGVVLRNLLGFVNNTRELKHILTSGEVLVDRKPRSSPSFPAGLFDVIEIPKEGIAYRLLPSSKGLVPSKTSEDEARLKLCRVKSKVKIKGGKIQYGLHDGRSLIGVSFDLSLGDSMLLKVPEQSVVSSIKLSQGSLGLVISGERAGQVGKILNVKKGSITRERMVTISLPSGETEIPSRLVFPVGTDKPVINMQVSNR
jgi:small subunit ribosomal protein S4e